MTDRKAERKLAEEAKGILEKNRAAVLSGCGVKVKEKKEIGKTVFKVIGVAASVLLIAALAYVCYLPIYMQQHGLLPSSGETDAASSSSGTDAASSSNGTGTAPYSAEETLAGPEQTGQKLTLDAVTDIISSSKSFEEIREKTAKIGEFAGIYGSGIIRTNYKLYSDFSETEEVGYLTVSDFDVSFTVGPNSYVLCRQSDYLPLEYGEETDPATGEKIIRIDEYMKDFALPDDSEKALRRIYSESARICTCGREILIPVSEYTTDFIWANYSKEPAKADYDGITYYRVDTAFNKTDFYLVFLASVQTFKDYWSGIRPVCIKLGVSDADGMYVLVFSTEYKKAGYDNLADYGIDPPESGFSGCVIGYRRAFVRNVPDFPDKINLSDEWFTQVSFENGYGYYGVYNGYNVRLVLSNLAVINNIKIGGYSFLTGSSAEIKAEKDGVSYDLKEVYEKGFLTEDDIADINIKHRSRCGLYYYTPEELEKAARYTAGLRDITNSYNDTNEFNRLSKELFKSIYGKSGTDPAEETAPSDHSGYKDKFAPDRFIVCAVTKSDGAEYTAQDFPEFELSAVKKLMDLNDGTCALVMYLKNPGEDNVLEAIELIRTRSDVKYAEPDFIMIIDD